MKAIWYATHVAQLLKLVGHRLACAFGAGNPAILEVLETRFSQRLPIINIYGLSIRCSLETFQCSLYELGTILFVDSDGRMLSLHFLLGLRADFGNLLGALVLTLIVPLLPYLI
jgi:predicted outer membrane lipoprotein